MCHRLTRESRGKCSIRYSAETRQFVTGTRLDDYLVGDFFYLWLRRVLPGFLVKREDSTCVSEVRWTPFYTESFFSPFQVL
ncbi:hypothetical protein DPMN_159982 [Dreissena polymorpha]|uniref:Uncharacterized protein n=1 Tax=Dreissena polymorpha TaxID=45954 RepID=A0A9D4ELZ1_DREPO|nr:hypothetical protein DPMN_159982 [Dreissena polymorpha]